MNRRELIANGAGAVAVACISGRSVAGHVFSLKKLCDKQWCQLFLETEARRNIEQTKDWKADLLRARPDHRMLFTFEGCCGCEVLPPDAGKSEWTYKRRNLTTSERESFHREYGKQAPLLLSVELGSGLQIRGFVLNGRKLGWNLSTSNA